MLYQVLAILDFSIRFIMILFQNAIQAQLKANKAILYHASADQTQLLSRSVSLTYSNITTQVKDIVIALDMTSSNATFYKSNLRNILEYLFGTKMLYIRPNRHKKKREHQKDQIFCLVFAEVRALFIKALPPKAVAKQQEDLYLVIYATNLLLPNLDSTSLLLQKQKGQGYAWLAYDQPNSLSLFDYLISCYQLINRTYL